jgi:hypothetical protein
MTNQCVWNSSPWQARNAMRYWFKISKNEKGGHSDTSQGKSKGCSLQRQAGCVHSDKPARSSVWRTFHRYVFGQAIKPRVVEDYNAHMVFEEKSDRMVNSYGTARRTWMWTKKLFFHLTDMTILNAFLIHNSCGGKMTHKKFHEILVRKLIIHSQKENVTASGPLWGRPSPFASQLSRLEVKHSQHWLSKGKQRLYCVCSLHKQTQSTLYFCRKCDVGLCVVNCFEKWHTHVNLSH